MLTITFIILCHIIDQSKIQMPVTCHKFYVKKCSNFSFINHEAINYNNHVYVFQLHVLEREKINIWFIRYNLLFTMSITILLIQ